ncbi:hypothetical protein Bbelb_294690 [Branchiostoma belcheri]|nr:hypothetical protein Bbelb_294690 [Branchiostoma belcheri]
MAANGTTSPQSLHVWDTKDNFLVCKLCSEVYTNPKLLPCLHTFCEDCLERFASVDVDIVECPVCRVNHTIPDLGVAGFEDNGFVASLCEALSAKDEDTRGREVPCSVCGDDEDGEVLSVSHCIECGDNLCPDCAFAHPRTKFTRGHHVVSLFELLFVKNKGKLDERRKDIDQDFDKEAPKYRAASERSLSKVKGFLDTASKKIPSYETSIRKLRESETHKARQKTEVSEQIAETTRKYISAVEEQKRFLLSELETVYEREKLDIEAEKDSLQVDLVRLRSTCDFTEKLLRYGSDLEVIQYQDRLIENLQEVGKLEPRDDIIEGLVGSELLFVTEDADVQYVLQKMGQLETRLKDDTTSVSEADANSADELDDVDRPILRKNDVDVMRLDSLTKSTDDETDQPERRDSMTHAKTTKRLVLDFGNDGEGEGQFLAPEGVLFTDTGDILVLDSIQKSMQVFGQEGEFKSRVKLPVFPRNVVWTKEGYLALTGNMHGRGCVVIMDPEGRELRRFDADGKLEFVHGIAVDSHSRFILTDVRKHKVTIHSPEGDLVHQFGKYGNDAYSFNKPHYVTVNSRDELIVCDRGNHYVKVYDYQGKFLRKFGGCGNDANNFIYPYGACVLTSGDSADDIVVCDSGHNMLKIFHSDGNFHRYVLTQDDGLMSPKTLALREEHNQLVLTERDRCYVKVYKLED